MRKKEQFWGHMMSKRFALEEYSNFCDGEKELKKILLTKDLIYVYLCYDYIDQGITYQVSDHNVNIEYASIYNKREKESQKMMNYFFKKFVGKNGRIVQKMTENKFKIQCLHFISQKFLDYIDNESTFSLFDTYFPKFSKQFKFLAQPEKCQGI